MNEIDMQVRSYQIIDKINKKIVLTKSELKFLSKCLILGILEKGETEVVNDYFDENNMVFSESDFSKLMLASLVQKDILTVNSNHLYSFLTENFSKSLFEELIADFSDDKDMALSIIDKCFENHLLDCNRKESAIMINDKDANNTILKYDLKYRVKMNMLSNMYINRLFEKKKSLKK